MKKVLIGLAIIASFIATNAVANEEKMEELVKNIQENRGLIDLEMNGFEGMRGFLIQFNDEVQYWITYKHYLILRYDQYGLNHVEFQVVKTNYIENYMTMTSLFDSFHNKLGSNDGGKRTFSIINKTDQGNTELLFPKFPEKIIDAIVEWESWNDPEEREEIYKEELEMWLEESRKKEI